MSAKAGVYDLTVTKNCALDEVLQLEDADNAVIDITGWTFKAQVRDRPEDDATKRLDIGVSIYDAAKGRVRLLNDETDSDLIAIPVGSYHWSLHKTNGSRRSLAKGIFAKSNTPTET